MLWWFLEFHLLDEVYTCCIKTSVCKFHKTKRQNKIPTHKTVNKWMVGTRSRLFEAVLVGGRDTEQNEPLFDFLEVRLRHVHRPRLLGFLFLGSREQLIDNRCSCLPFSIWLCGCFIKQLADVIWNLTLCTPFEEFFHFLRVAVAFCFFSIAFDMCMLRL